MTAVDQQGRVDRRGALRILGAGSLAALVEGAVPRLARANTGGVIGTPWRRDRRGRAPLPANAAIVLVHAAWADGSNWQRVVLPLERHGFKVICAPIPMTTLSDDVAAVGRAIDRTTGPVVLVGHAYSGGVVGAVHHDRVKALVYVAALAPAEGETVAKVFYQDKPSPEQPKLAPDAAGWIWMSDDGFARAVAHKASRDETRILTAVQRPLHVKCIQEAVPTPSWTTTPTWYLVAEEDRMINPITQRFMSTRMKAHVRSFPVDHSPQISAPGTVVDIVTEAARATLVQQAG